LGKSGEKRKEIKKVFSVTFTYFALNLPFETQNFWAKQFWQSGLLALQI